MKYKHVIMLLPILMACSLFSIGFASWVILPGTETEDIDGYLDTEQVINSKDYIEVSAIDSFKYYQYGFLDINNYWSEFGIMRVTYEVDVLNCKSLLGDDCNSINVSFSLMYSVETEYDIIGNLKDDISVESTNSIVSYNIISSELELNDSDSYRHGATVNFTGFNSLESFIFVVEYNTNSVGFGESFYNDIYPYLDSIEFQIETFVTKGN